MAKVINMPKMGNTVTTVIFSEWFVKEGDTFQVGDKLFSYETDKTTTEEIAQENSTVLKLLVESDQEIAVFSPVMIVGEKTDDISQLLEEIKPKDSVLTANKPEITSEKILNPEVENLPISKEEVNQNLTNEQNFPNHLSISPRALKLLRQSGIPLSSVSGSGINKRIISQDVINASNQQFSKQQISLPKNPVLEKITKLLQVNNQQGEQKVVYSPMRQAIAKAMIQSQKQSAFTTLSIAIDAHQLLEARKKIKQNLQSGKPNISLNDLIIYAVSRVLPNYKHTMNAHVEDSFSTTHSEVNLAIAVDTPQGLIVPVIKSAHLKSLETISQEAKTMIDLARKGDYKNLDLRSGTFTISNVGSMGIEVFTPVLNAGQAAILGVGTTVLRPRLNHQNLIEFYHALILSLTIDHRLADGADGARFLKDLKLILENINLIIND